MMGSFGSLKQAIFDKEARKQQYQDHIRGLNAYDRHKKFLNDYVGYYGKDKSAQETLPVKTDQDTLREGYRFIRTDEDDMNPSWEQRLVKRYYDKLFKEYCIADMSQYKTGKIGLRWRTEKEVISGKVQLLLRMLVAGSPFDSLRIKLDCTSLLSGQFVCGNKHCNEKDDLSSYEVNFSYFEAGEHKQALVKLVACERCAAKLYYKKQKEKEQLKRKENEKHQRKRSQSEDDADVDYGRSKERRKGDKASTSATDHNKTDDNNDNFDEFLEGMFP
ncbi:protein FRA10AC1 isoform X2 [Sesamum indicum]|uniref:Protein FRA10AC1 isoform X2 n=1 Tax=Sesamum indicum TaxID=4182 RepID=A0A8M8VAU8_SESIN|nr:protein FRA10AC1 isoform X2 [Sesamum indicum]